MAAARLFERGLTPAEVARRLEVSCQSAVTWLRTWESQGRAGLRGARRAGRLPRLNAEQLGAVEAALLEGARAHGYSTDLWTLARVAEVIDQVTGIAYHQGHVWRILRSMGWSRQKPARRALERDDEPVARWVRDVWPQEKKARRRKPWIVFEDESGFSLIPSARSTWAPRGQTPVLHHRFGWKRVSAAGLVAYRHDGGRARLMMHTTPGAHNDEC